MAQAMAARSRTEDCRADYLNQRTTEPQPLCLSDWKRLAIMVSAPFTNKEELTYGPEARLSDSGSHRVCWALHLLHLFSDRAWPEWKGIRPATLRHADLHFLRHRLAALLCGL